MIYVYNGSTLLTDADVHLMTRAVARQVRYHAAPAWGLHPVPVVYVADPKVASPGAWVIAVLDDSDQADALGWHTEEQGDLIYGRVFARPALDNGVDVSSVLSHEVLEVMADPRVNLWADDGAGTMFAVEVCDPVESLGYPVAVPQHEGGFQMVTVSDFVTPSWFDPYSGGPFDWMEEVTAPFEMTSGGYVIVREGGLQSERFGRQYPEWRRATKRTSTARTERRLTHAP